MVHLPRTALALLACLLCLEVCTPLEAAGTKTADRCGVNREQPPARIFADSDGKGWREYKTVKEIPELQLNTGSAAFLWEGRDGNVLVATQVSGEGFSAYTDYCFDRSRTLVQLRFELRTAWGWGFREEGPFSRGTLKAATSEYFSTETEKAIAKPEEAGDIPEALKPLIYSQEPKLPFFKLLSK